MLLPMLLVKYDRVVPSGSCSSLQVNGCYLVLDPWMGPNFHGFMGGTLVIV